MTFARLPLTFELSVEDAVHQDEFDDSAPERPYRSVQVRPFAGGHELVASPHGLVFDAVSVLAHGVEYSEFDPYTCSCGVAGCAGIHFEVALQVDADEVRWVFPEDPYRTLLNPALREEGQPLVLRFERTQYLEALADLQARILALGADGGLPVTVSPDEWPDLDVPVAEMLARARKHTLEWIERDRARRALLGRLWDLEVLVVLPNGARLCMSAARLADEVATNEAEARALDVQEVFEQQVVPAFRESDDAILAAARALTGERMRALSWVARDGDAPSVPCEGDIEEQWRHAVLVVRPGA